jgi:choline kinase
MPASRAVVKVRMNGTRVTDIGKTLTTYDALDTGLFVCTPSLFAALDAARLTGDTTLSGGIRQLAAQRRMRGVDIGNTDWYDIDTLGDLQHAESLLAGQAETA